LSENDAPVPRAISCTVALSSDFTNSVPSPSFGVTVYSIHLPSDDNAAPAMRLNRG